MEWRDLSEEDQDRITKYVITIGNIYARKELGTRFQQADFIQEAWVGALSALKRFDPDRGNLFSWVWNSTWQHLNVLIRESKCRSGQGRAYIKEGVWHKQKRDFPQEDCGIEVDGKYTSPEDAASMIEFSDRVGQLPTLDRELIGVIVRGGSLGDAGRKLGKSRERMRQRLNRALERMGYEHF